MEQELTSPVTALQDRAKETPDKLAFLFLDQGEIETDKLTYGDLDQNARMIAAQLRKDHKPGTRALLLYPTGADFVSAFYGCLYAGVIPIPTNPPRLNRPAIRLKAIVNDSKAAVALTDTEFIKDLEKRSQLVPELNKLAWIDHKSFDRALADSWDEPAPDLGDGAFIQYTSGSTSSPRGVVISHENVAYNTLVIRELRQREEDITKVTVNWAPIYHDMGLITGTLQSVYDDSLSIMMTPVAFLQKPVRLLRAISKYKGTASGGPNFSFDICTNKILDEECEGLDLSSWKIAWNSAEPIRAETQERFANKFGKYGFERASFNPGYGLAEATLLVSAYNGRKETTLLTLNRSELEDGHVQLATDDDNAQELTSCGPPLLGTIVRIVNPETCKICAPEEVGEIWVQGMHVSKGYWDREDETEYSFNGLMVDSDEGAFMRTGDLGFLYDGDLYVAGRLKDMIIVRGKNYYPQDIENTVENSHEAIQPGGGASFSVEIDGTEYLTTIHEVKREYRTNLDADEVTKAIRFAIARDQGIRASAVVLIRPYSLPKTSSGKVMRHAAKNQFLNDELKIAGEWRAKHMESPLNQASK